MWGKILGAFFGFSLAGPLGALFGILIGNLFDKGLGYARGANFSSVRGQTRRIFNDVTFAVMGHIAKSDGRVSEDEIQMANNAMATMRLSATERREAIRSFSKGKSAGFQLGFALTELKHATRLQPTLLKTFVEIQYNAAVPNGRRVNLHKQRLLNNVFQQLGFMPIFQTEQPNHSRWQHSHQSYQNYQSYQGSNYRYTPPIDELAEAYKTLGISSASTAAEIKKAYRKLMSQHHPDKLIAKGLTDEQVKQGTAKAQKIQAAYEKVRQSRGF